MAPRNSRGKGTMVAFLAGATSGTCSTLLFQPLDLVKTRMQIHALAMRSTPAPAVCGCLWVKQFWSEMVKEIHNLSHPPVKEIHCLTSILCLSPAQQNSNRQCRWNAGNIQHRDKKRELWRTLEGHFSCTSAYSVQYNFWCYILWPPSLLFVLCRQCRGVFQALGYILLPSTSSSHLLGKIHLNHTGTHTLSINTNKVHTLV